jgi:hypothetical protein
MPLSISATVGLPVLRLRTKVSITLWFVPSPAKPGEPQVAREALGDLEVERAGPGLAAEGVRERARAAEVGR